MKQYKISEDMLNRYFKSSTGFRLEIRNISKGWALNGAFAMPSSLANRSMFKEKINKNHPLQNLSMALYNGYIKDALTSELLNIDNWVYCEETGKHSIADKYAWLFNSIDSHFLTSAFPCWIPADIEAMSLSALAAYYQYKEIKYKTDDESTHIYKLSFDYKDNIYYASIVDLNNKDIVKGFGKEMLIAVYDLYEKAWNFAWNENAPSITYLSKVIDIQKKEDNKFVLFEDSYNFEREHSFYLIGYSQEYNHIDCYKGRYKFLEGEFELFERPLYSKRFKIESVNSLLDAVEKELI